MRHRKSINHLGRTSSHRKAMLANMAVSLIMHKRIKTTTAKAKALRKYLEPLITKSKDDSTHSRRIVFSYLQDKNAVTELFREVSAKVADRPGGYTRILKTGARLGDNADMCIIELVDYNENLLMAKEESASKSGRRRRRGSKKKSGDEIKKSGTVEAVQEHESVITENTNEVKNETEEETEDSLNPKLSADNQSVSNVENNADSVQEKDSTETVDEKKTENDSEEKKEE